MKKVLSILPKEENKNFIFFFVFVIIIIFLRFGPNRQEHSNILQLVDPLLYMRKEDFLVA